MDTALSHMKARCKLLNDDLFDFFLMIRVIFPNIPPFRKYLREVYMPQCGDNFSARQESSFGEEGQTVFFCFPFVLYFFFLTRFQGLLSLHTIPARMISCFNSCCESSEGLSNPLSRIFVSWILGRRNGAKCLDLDRTPKNTVLNGIGYLPGHIYEPEKL